MKQELKISIGSSLQKAATCLTVAAVIAALGFTFSCSSDNDYEEPWLDKEILCLHFGHICNKDE